MATTLEIIRDIAQAVANINYDGAHEGMYGDGEPRPAGLKREEGHMINDRRVIDGFGVKFMGNVLRINYQSELQLKEVYANGFEDEIGRRFAEIVKFLKKEYKSLTGRTLSLKPMGEHDILVQHRSRVWTWCQAHCDYKIGGLTGVVDDEAQKELSDRNFRNLLNRGLEGYSPETP
ncbi:MAG: hypothetical protein CME38_16440 [Haliea sp.]|nr:hypothetical protein [Haliea sp.]|tara:strand:+ start:1590 stop:2117 length:528 start_codon:yes stop_codon:yes gene_type:complete